MDPQQDSKSLATHPLFNDLLNAGTSRERSAFRIQVYQVANLTCLGAILINLAFFVLCLHLPDPIPRTIPLVATVFYLIAFWTMYRGHPKIARSVLLFSATCVIFVASCYGGEKNWIQAMFFAVMAQALMIFDWDEWILTATFILFPLSLFGLAEWVDYRLPFLPVYQGPVITGKLRLFSVVGSISIAMGSLFFFRRQIRLHRLSIEKYVVRLREEHQLQLHAHKMASLGEMAAGMAHEINTPLTAINLRASKLRLLIDRSRVQESDRLAMQDEASRILDTTFRISKIISSLRTFSNPHEGEPFELAEVERIILDTLDLCSQRLRIAGIKVHLEIARDLMIHCRPSEISQVLLNLLNNAYDAVDAWAKSQEQPVETWIRMEARKEKDRVRILVSNPGQPIPKSQQDKLFEPFFTTKRPGKGTGLGLSISRALIENHGGSLSWLSDQPQTTFCMELPARPSDFKAGMTLPLVSKAPEGTTLSR